jgi:hypothetical protein
VGSEPVGSEPVADEAVGRVSAEGEVVGVANPPNAGTWLVPVRLDAPVLPPVAGGAGLVGAAWLDGPEAATRDSGGETT